MRDFIRQYTSDVTPVHLALFIAFGALVTLLLITVPAKYPLLILAGIFVLTAIARKPELGVLIIVILTSSIVFEESLPLIPIGIGSFHISDVLLLFMLGTLGYRYLAESNHAFVKSPLNKPLLLFLVWSLFSAAIAIARYGVDFNDATRFVRLLSYYLVFFLITNLVSTERRLRFLIKGMFTISVVVVAAMIVQAVIGESIQLIPGRIEAAVTMDRFYGTLRILPPGQTLVFVTFISAICALVLTQGKPILFSGYFYLSLLLGTGIVLTYNRSYWIAVALGGLILLMVTARDERTRLMALIIVTILFVGSFITAFGGTGGKLGNAVDAVSDRFSSIFAGKELRESSSLDYRRMENEYAIAQARQHPFMGIGLGNQYRPTFYRDDKMTHYVHNNYLWLLTDMGIIGFLCFTWFYLRFLVRAFRNWKRIEDDFLKSAVVGFMISGTAMLPMALVIPIFMEWFSIVVIACMIGLTEALIGNQEKATENKETV